MLNLLNASVGEYLKENVVLTVVLALILALIAALSCIMIYLQIQAKKNGAEPTNEQKAPEGEDETELKEETAQERTEETAEPLTEETVEEPSLTKEPIVEEQVEEPFVEEHEEEPFVEQKAEVTAKTSTEETAEPAKKPAAKKIAKAEVKNEDDRPVGFQDGKWVIKKTDSGKYAFMLYASNGGLMLESSKEYASLSTAKQGIETYKKNFAENNCSIVSPKPAHFVYRLTNANGMLLAVSPNYTSKSSCENALESTKRYAMNAPVEVV